MDQKSKSKGGAMAAILLVVVGVIMMPFAIVVLTSYPNEIWPLGLILVSCSGLVLFGAISTFKRSSRQSTDTYEQISQIQKNAIDRSTNISSAGKAPQSIETGFPVKSNQVLVDWVYSKEEWKRFTNWELGRRNWVNIFVSLSITIVSVFILKGFRDFPWMVALGIGGIGGFLYGFFSYWFAINSIGKAENATNAIIITTNAVLINDKLYLFADEEKWMGEIEILEEPTPKILQITYHWKTHHGESSDNIHVPIPKGKLGEAVMLMSRLNRVSGE